MVHMLRNGTSTAEHLEAGQRETIQGTCERPRA